MNFNAIHRDIKNRFGGSELYETALSRMGIREIGCLHTRNYPELDCIRSCVADANPQGFYVAINGRDDDIEQLQGMGNVPLISANGDHIYIRTPSIFQQEFSEDEEKRAGDQQQRGGRR